MPSGRITGRGATLDDGYTVLSISEQGWKTDVPGLKASHENCSGWTHMAMCLKGYIEHGLDLRSPLQDRPGDVSTPC